MRMLFEVQDLAVASPATVSRCGMVYVPLEELGWRPFVQTWLDTAMEEVAADARAHLWELFDTLVQPLLDWVRQNGKEYFKSVDVNLVTTMACIVQSLVTANQKLIFKVRLRMRFGLLGVMCLCHTCKLFTVIFTFTYVVGQRRQSLLWACVNETGRPVRWAPHPETRTRAVAHATSRVRDLACRLFRRQMG